MRTAQVQRTFGNKATWDTPFENHFRAFAAEANAAVFSTKNRCQATCFDALCVPGEYDLVYIDTPYINKSGVGVDYHDFYHFLEGMTDYSRWAERIDHDRKHKPLIGVTSPWSDARKSMQAFDQLFHKFSRSILVVSYRSDGIPSEEELLQTLRKYKSSVKSLHFGGYKYVLSKNGESREILLIGE